MKPMDFKIVIIVMALVLCAGPQAFAGNNGNIFQVQKDQLQLNKEGAAQRTLDAQKRTEKLNKDLKAQRKKEAKAKAKAKSQAEKRKKKAEKEARKANEK